MRHREQFEPAASFICPQLRVLCDAVIRQPASYSRGPASLFPPGKFSLFGNIRRQRAVVRTSLVFRSGEVRQRNMSTDEHDVARSSRDGNGPDDYHVDSNGPGSNGSRSDGVGSYNAGRRDLPEMHDLGGQRHGLDRCRRHSKVPRHWSGQAARPASRFAQVSDSHLGFSRPVNTDVTGTFQEALGHVTSMADEPAFLIHTGDITHLSTADQFDTCAQLLGATRLQTYTVPGEHDILEDNGKSYLNRYGKGDAGRRLVQLRCRRGPLHRPGQCRQPARQRPRRSGGGATRVAGKGREGAVIEHAGRGVRARAALDCLPGLGLGDERWRAGTVVFEALRVRYGAERPHPSGDAESRGPRCFPHRPVNRVSTGCSRRAKALDPRLYRPAR